jgi:plastocyanin
MELDLNIIDRLLISLVFTAILSQGLAAAEYRITVTDQDQNPVPDAIVSFTSPSTLSVNPEIAVMDQVSQQFSPKVLVIEKNQQVVFPNSDNTRHHVYSFSPAKPFEIKLYSGTPNTSVTFDKAGVIILGCNIHDNMIAYIYVKQKEIAVLTNHDGAAIFKKPPKDAVFLWHFDMKKGNEKNAYQLKKTDEFNWSVELELMQRRPKKSNTFKARYR